MTVSDRFTQENRLISIATPLGEHKLLLRSLYGQEAISQLFSFQLELLSEDIDVDHSLIVGQNVTVRMKLVEDGTERFFNGFVSRFSQGSGSGRFTTYSAEVVPWLWFLTKTADCRIFQNQTIPEIIEQVFQTHGFSDYENKLQRAYKSWEYCVQYRETACNFVMRLMEQEGIFFFFRHENGKHVLVMGDSPAAHKPCPDQSTVRYEHSTGSGKELDEDYIFDWQPSYELRPGRWALNDYYFETPRTSLLANIEGRIDEGGNKQFEIYDYPGEYEKKDEGDTWVRLRMEEEEAPHTVISGAGRCRAFTPGFRFDLTEHSRKDQNATYVITSVIHSASSGGTFIEDTDEGGGYTNNFTCMPFTVPFRPQRVTPRPHVQGCQTATVVGPAGEEIYVDKYGRVKVQFHWDRRGKADENSSCWIRVSQIWSGKRWGSMHTPRIGHEVVVDFLEGDPDRPLIVGSVYNGENMPHYQLPDFKTISGIKSDSSKGSKGFNEIRFEDKKDQEQVFVHSQKRMDVRVLGSLYESNHADRHEVIGLPKGTEQGGNLNTTVAGDNNIHIRGGRYELIEGKLNLAVGNEVVYDFQSSHSTLVATKSELNAQKVIIEASDIISLKVGASFITIEPSGVTIYGETVKINSGGYGVETGDPSIEDPLDASVSDTGEPGNLERLRKRPGGPAERKSRTLRSKHAKSKPRPGENPRMTAIRDTLHKSATGRHALEVYDRYEVKSDFPTGKGGSYSWDNNTMTLDPSWGEESNSRAFVHEMNHAQHDHEGTGAEAKQQTRDEYIDRQLREEAEGDALANQAHLELVEAGVPMKDTPNMQDKYLEGYGKGVTEAQSADPKATPEDLHAAGRRGAEQAIVDEYRSGRVVPSDVGGKKQPPYPEYYGRIWDNVNKVKSK